MPDISENTDNIAKAMFFLMRLFVSKNSVGDFLPELTASEWQELYQRAKKNGLTGAFYRCLKNNGYKDSVPAPVYEQFENDYYRILYSNTIASASVKEIATVLGKNHIRLYLVKGTFLTDYVYEDAGVRPMLDLDLLVRSEDFEKACALIEKTGFRQITTFKNNFIKQLKFHYNVAFVRDRQLLELHFDLTAKHDYIRFDISEIISKAQPVNEAENTYRLSHDDNLIYLCAHLIHHNNNLQTRLSAYLDLAVMFKKFGKEIHFDKLLKRAEQFGIRNEVNSILWVIFKEFFPEAMPAEFVQDADALQQQKYFRGLLNENIKGFRKKKNYSFSRKIKGMKSPLVLMRYLLSELFPSLLYIQKRYLLKSKVVAFFYYPVHIIKLLGKL